MRVGRVTLMLVAAVMMCAAPGSADQTGSSGRTKDTGIAKDAHASREIDMAESPHEIVKPLIVGHRGASFDAPENTLASFKLAFEQNADAIEGDFHLTRDGQIVTLHDADFRRVAGVEKKASDLTFDETQQLDVGSWKSPAFAGERPPALSQILEMLPPGRLFLMEIKCGPEIVPVLRQVLSNWKGSIDQLRVISFNADVIAAVKKTMPEMQAYWLTSFKKDEQGVFKPTLEEVLSTLDRIDADGLDAKAEMRVLTPDFVGALRDGDYAFHAWTVDDPAVAKALIELGVDSITTNRPAFLREELAK